MSVTLDQLEALGLLAAEQERFVEYVAEQGIDPAAAGIFCANLAEAALRSLGYGSTASPDLGPAFTTTALCAFEIALRAREAVSG